LFREFVVAKRNRDDDVQMATFQAYQTVRIWAITKSKRRMPPLKDMLGTASTNTLDANTSPERARAMLELMAARTGGKVRVVTSGK